MAPIESGGTALIKRSLIMHSTRNDGIIDLKEIARSKNFLNLCRNSVRTSQESLIIPGESVFGYELRNERCQKYQLEGSIQNIAAFLASSNYHKLVCTMMDLAILNSNGSDLDLCVDHIYRQELLYYIHEHKLDSQGDFVFLEQ